MTEESIIETQKKEIEHLKNLNSQSKIDILEQAKGFEDVIEHLKSVIDRLKSLIRELTKYKPSIKANEILEGIKH